MMKELLQATSIAMSRNSTRDWDTVRIRGG